MSTLQEKSTRIPATVFIKIEDEGDTSDTYSENSFSEKEKLFCAKITDAKVEENRDPELPRIAKYQLANGTVLADAHKSLIRSTSRPLQSHRITETFGKIVVEEDSKIDIEECLLEEVKLEHPSEATKPRKHDKASFYKFIKSLNVLCDICDDSRAERVIKLNKQERFSAAIVLRKVLSLGLKQKRIISRKIPEQSCERCFTRIVLFRNRLKEKILERKIKEVRHMDPPYSHGIQCPCLACQNQYGSLGLIIRGMETLSSHTQTQHMLPTSDWMRDTSQEQKNFQMHELQPSLGGQQSFEAPQEMSQPFPGPPHTIGHDISHFHSTGVDLLQSTSCFEASSTSTMSYSQDHQSYPAYSGYSSSHSHSLIESNLAERCRLDPQQPSTSSGYHGRSEESTYPPYSRPHSQCSIGAPTESSSRESSLPTMLQDFEERSQIDPTQPSQYPGQSQSEEERTSRKTKRVCNHCQKQFNHTGDFRKHLRKHTKEKPYACKQCDKRFSHTSNLHRHERSHTGVRPYKCEFCNKEFNRKDKLDSHKKCKSCKNRRHEGGK